MTKIYSQDQLPVHAIQLVGGPTRHGSGDADGLTYGAEYVRYYTKKFSLTYNLRGTIHNYKDEYEIIDVASGRTTDNSIRFTTAGVQAGVNAGYSIVRTRSHEVMISLGAFGRYQSSSDDGYFVYYPSTVINPIPNFLFRFDNTTPQKTFSLGALLQIKYNLRIGKHLYTGVAPFLQTDTQGDLIRNMLLVIGRRF